MTFETARSRGPAPKNIPFIQILGTLKTCQIIKVKDNRSNILYLVTIVLLVYCPKIHTIRGLTVKVHFIQDLSFLKGALPLFAL